MEISENQHLPTETHVGICHKVFLVSFVRIKLISFFHVANSFLKLLFLHYLSWSFDNSLRKVSGGGDVETWQGLEVLFADSNYLFPLLYA